MEIAYRALTETCTLLLDANGICRSVLAATASHQGRVARIPASAERCIGAQYVATLDFRDPTGLTHMPEPGAPMLFARIEDDGRITLVRSAKVIAFQAVAQIDSGVRTRPATVSYGDDEESTVPFELDELTIPRRQAYTPSQTHAARVPAPAPVPYSPPPVARPPRPSIQPIPVAVPRGATSPPPRPSAQPPRPSSLPPPHPSERSSSYPPPRTSGKVSILREEDSARMTIPPPPPMPRRNGINVIPQAPSPPRRPSLVKVPPPAYEGPTLPFRRTAR